MTPDVAKLLTQPVPDQGPALSCKNGYREYPMQLTDERSHEPLVDIATYGIAGQSHYSRPNTATGDAIPEVNPTVYVRKGIAERLSTINNALQASSEITSLLGGNVELYVEEGLRSQETQQLLYTDVFPRLIRTQFPSMNEHEVAERRNNMIAMPSKGEDSPSPHATGAAVDIALRHAQATKSYVPNVGIFMGHRDADMSDTARPDFFEQTQSPNDQYQLAQRNRRLFYWIMKGTLCDQESNLCVNPTEWWHWSYGDQMWATITGAPYAFYGSARV